MANKKTFVDDVSGIESQYVKIANPIIFGIQIGLGILITAIMLPLAIIILFLILGIFS